MHLNVANNKKVINEHITNVRIRNKRNESNKKEKKEPNDKNKILKLIFIFIFSTVLNLKTM